MLSPPERWARRLRLEANAGTDSTGGTVLNIERSGLNLKARIFRGDRDAATGTRRLRPTPGAMLWYKRANANASWAQVASSARELNITQAEMDACYQYRCVYTDEAVSYGTVSVNTGTMMASHTPGTTDAGDVFALANGKLSVTSNSPAAAGYRLENGVLKIDGAANEQIEAIANFVRCTTAKTVSFAYDHNGLRTQKKIVEGSTTTIYVYTLRGKLITHLTKTVNGTKSDEMHFFYDAQGKPAMVKHGNNLYRYVHNLQGDIVGMIDGAGTLVVEYKYDAWGKPVSATGSLKTTLGKMNPFRYRGYVWDDESGLYYLRNRYYSACYGRFISGDVSIYEGILSINVFSYCINNPVARVDHTGNESYYVVLNIFYKDDWNGGYGHYDISVISKENPDTGWTFSYGGIIEDPDNLAKDNMYPARIDAYKSPERDKTPAKRLVIFDDYSEEEYQAFKKWFNEEFELGYSNKKKKVVRYYVTSGEFSSYHILGKKYCGSGAMYLVSQMRPNASNPGLNSAKMLLTNYVVKVTDRIIDVFSKFFKEYNH